LAVAILLAPTFVFAASPSRDPEVALSSNTVAGLNQAGRIADEDAGKIIDVQLALKLRNRAQLDDLIRRVSTPGSPEYGHYLTPDQFGAQFGPTAAQVDQATAFLRANGLQVTAAVPGSTLVDARGTVAAVQQALHTQIGHYREPGGHEFFANDTAPALPSSLAANIAGVQGLNNRHQRHHPAVQPRVCPPTCAGTPYTPTQLRTGFGLTTAPLTTLTGTGQTLGLLELDDFRQANINGYDTTYSLPALTPQRQVVDFGAGISNAGEMEVELDIEVMHALAPGATILVFEGPNSDQGVNDTYGCMVDPNAGTSNGPCPNQGSGITAPSNSTSWGLCEFVQGQGETNTLGAIFAQAAAQGQSFFAASGDTGAYDCYPDTSGIWVDSPASDPNVTGVGGTKLFLNPDNSYNSEIAWPAEPQSFYGSGGGKSIYLPKPAWQTGPGVDVSANAPRQVPDVSLDADPVTGYSVYTCANSSGSCTGSGAKLRPLGGTSAGAPAWAAFTAVYNQYAAGQAKPNLGFANPTLYGLASCAQPFTPFNDVTTGNNKEDTALGYSAGANYDMVTGLGSLRASDLAQDAAGPPSSVLKVGSLDKTVGVTGYTVHVFGCGFATSGGEVPSVIFGSRPSPNVTYLGLNDLSVVVPFNLNGTVSITVTNPAGAGGGSATLLNAFTYNQPPPPPPPAGGTNLYAALLNGGGGGQVEVHGLAQSTHYSQFMVHAASAIGSVVVADWQFFIAPFRGDGQADLFGIHVRGTGSGQVEVHVLSAASGYRNFILHAATPIGAIVAGQFEFALGSLAGDDRSDLFAIAMNNTGSNTIEVHALSETSNYSSWVLHSPSAFAAPLGTSSWLFRIGDRNGNGDLIGISHTATGSGRTEVHVLTRASGYQAFSVHTATPLGYTADSQFTYALGDHDADGIPDIYAIDMNNTGTGQTEVHIVSGASNYNGWIEHAPTALGPTGPTSWQFSAR